MPTTAPYGALEALRLAGLTVNIQAGASTVATPSLADIAVHKNVYLGDADGNGVYTGTDAGLISRVVAGIDTGFDAHSWTDPLIIADADATNNLTGGDAALVAQKSVLLPTPQIPNLPGIPLTPNGGGSLALDDVPQTASTSVVSSPSRLAAAVVEVPVAAETNTTVVGTFTARPSRSMPRPRAHPDRPTATGRSSCCRWRWIATLVWRTDVCRRAMATVRPLLHRACQKPPRKPRDVDHYFSQLPTEMAAAVHSQHELAAAANNDEDDATDCYFESLSEDELLLAAL